MSAAMMPLAAWNLGELQTVPLPEINHHFGGGVYAKETKIPAGMMLQQHAHPTHDHLSILADGIASVAADGAPVIYEGPCCITIKAGIAHEVFAHSDVTWYCIHATEETDPEKVDKVLIA